MFLRRVQLENVKSVEQLDLTFEADGDVRRWTFVVGENGTGQTTLLRAIALALAGSEALPELLGDPTDWVRRGTAEARISVGLEVDGQRLSTGLSIRPDDTLDAIRTRNADALAALDALQGSSQENAFTIGYGPWRRPGDGDAEPAFRSPRARRVATLFSADATLAPLEAWAAELEAGRRTALPALRAAINALLPGAELESIDRDSSEVTFTTPDGRLPHRLLDEGHRTVAAWTGDLVAHAADAFPDAPDALGIPGLLLVDELGLHLHPTWQRRLIERIESTFPGLQVVASTDSPLAVHAAAERELYVLQRAGPTAATQLVPFVGAPRTLMLHQLLASPAFAIGSLDSAPVEELTREYRRLRDTTRRSRGDDARFSELREAVSDLPDWSEPIETQEEVKRLLRDVRTELTER